ncbi:hypothetical protein BT69DRAFT_1216286 [Atractiella rhizophila]|nr:hypothetical protein BT69DRAFT_1216286 [Atractiella rhizophila]
MDIKGGTDIFEKEAKFRLWLVEERFINPETLPKSKELFHTFVEDYDTITFSHPPNSTLSQSTPPNSQRYKWGSHSSTSEMYDEKADDEALRKSFRRGRKEEDSFLSREELEQLRRIEREDGGVGDGC